MHRIDPAIWGEAKGVSPWDKNPYGIYYLWYPTSSRARYWGAEKEKPREEAKAIIERYVVPDAVLYDLDTSPPGRVMLFDMEADMSTADTLVICLCEACWNGTRCPTIDKLQFHGTNALRRLKGLPERKVPRD